MRPAPAARPGHCLRCPGETFLFTGATAGCQQFDRGGYDESRSRPEARLKDQARSLGFALVGIARAAEADGFARLRDWLARGYAGEMAYMGRHAAARRHPAAVLPEVRSVVMVGMEYEVVGWRGGGVVEKTTTTPPP